MANNTSDSLTLHSSFEEIKKLEPFLEALQERQNFSDDQFERVRLAANEAVTNGIVHGNQEDAAKSVHISVSASDDTLKISVQDEGPGFDPETLPDPLEEGNLLKDSGRGIFLIKQYADEVEFSENATKLTMRFALEEGY
jgi:serine/threonine-protein kinase RsbW